MRDGQADNDRSDPAGGMGDRPATSGRATSSIGALGSWWDEPSEWAITVFKAGDRRVRLHVLFLAFAIILIADAAWPRPGANPISDVAFAGIGVAAVLAAVIWHELGHALMHRVMGGQLYESVIWPLGGLDTARPNRRWVGQVVGAMGGPIANLVAAAGLTAFLLTQIEYSEYVLFNPLQPWLTYAKWSLTAPSWFLICLWWLNYANLMVGVCNLLPVYPLDGADLLSGLLWARSNQRRAIEVTTMVGYVGSVAALIIGLGIALPLLVACSLFCWFVCWQNRRRLAFIEGIDPPTELIDVASPSDRPSVEAPVPAKAPEPGTDEAAIPETDDEAVVDAVLAKVSDHGIESLTGSERAVLQRATDRRRAAGRRDGASG